MVTSYYPHELRYDAAPPVSPGRDANGHYVPSAVAPDYVKIICRAKPNDAGKTIASADGQQVVYSFTVYLPPSELVLKEGAQVEVTNHGRVLANGKVKGFFSNPLGMSFKL